MKIEKIAIIGATGLVGQKIFQYLLKSNFPYTSLDLFASKRIISNNILINDINTINFANYDLIFFATNEKISKKYIPIALKNNCFVIDNSSAYRLDKNVPLLIPCINFSTYKNEKLIANPNCATAILCNVLKPIDDLFNINKIILSTYQSISGAGNNVLNDFIKQTKAILHKKQFTSDYDLAFSCSPLIGEIKENNFSIEENKIIAEVQKILEKSVTIIPTCIRTPTLFCHGESLYIETKNKIDIDTLIDKLKSFPDIIYTEDFPKNSQCANKKEVYVSRLRQIDDYSICMYIIGDNLLKGAASNAVDIAFYLQRM